MNPQETPIMSGGRHVWGTTSPSFTRPLLPTLSVKMRPRGWGPGAFRTLPLVVTRQAGALPAPNHTPPGEGVGRGRKPSPSRCAMAKMGASIQVCKFASMQVCKDASILILSSSKAAAIRETMMIPSFPMCKLHRKHPTFQEYWQCKKAYGICVTFLPLFRSVLTPTETQLIPGT